ncbi:MAG: NAD kinase [Alphaproteobacteria bacterium]|nr:NAD kinase [Alphaproteobacteria bacterium]
MPKKPILKHAAHATYAERAARATHAERATRIAFVADGAPAAREAKRACTKLYGGVAAKDADVIVALGGDGFMLHTLHGAIDGVPIFGMNVGTIGFLMNEYRTEGLAERLARAVEVRLHPLQMVATTRSGRRHTALAINEVSLLRASSQMAKLRISIDGIVRMESLACDGAIASTTAGSTAYNLSAYGPILPLGSRLLALTPISAHRPRHWRGAILPAEATIRFEILEPDKRPVNATADHREGQDVLDVRVAEARDRAVRLLFDPEHNLEERIVREQFASYGSTGT